MTQPERRACERYSGDAVLQFYSRQAGEPVACQARVHDVSAGGIGLHVSSMYISSLSWFLPGDELAIALPGEEPGRLLGARVAHVSGYEDGWLLGCALDEYLSIEELEWLRQNEMVGCP
jgi:hypothetical protein